MKSESLNELFAALAKAQAEMPIAELAANNPFFKSKYADFTTLVKASRPSLSKHGLSVAQFVRNNHLVTILGHASGQYIESEIEIKPQKQDVQALGSYMSYLKRYSYGALVGITSGEEDDDGEVAMQRSASQVTSYQSSYAKAPADMKKNDLVSEDQVQTLENAFSDCPDPELYQSFLEKLKIDNLYEVPREQYQPGLNWINRKKLELMEIRK